MVVIALVLKLPDSKRDKLTLTQQLHKLDPVGTAVFLPSVVCLLLALQWGGTVYPWSDARIIALLTLCPIFLAAFVVVQLWKKETATVPPRIIKQRSVAAGMWLAFSNGASMMTLVVCSLACDHWCWYFMKLISGIGIQICHPQLDLPCDAVMLIQSGDTVLPPCVVSGNKSCRCREVGLDGHTIGSRSCCGVYACRLRDSKGELTLSLAT